MRPTNLVQHTLFPPLTTIILSSSLIPTIYRSSSRPCFIWSLYLDQNFCPYFSLPFIPVLWTCQNHLGPDSCHLPPNVPARVFPLMYSSLILSVLVSDLVLPHYIHRETQHLHFSNSKSFPRLPFLLSSVAVVFVISSASASFPMFGDWVFYFHCSTLKTLSNLERI